VLEPTLVVETGYLRSAYASVEKLYGDRGTYLRDGLGLDDDTISALRGLLRET
jgi:protein-tyrosine phosphatase